MSMPRYTCAESTLTISTGKRSASESASEDFPEQVGPISSTTGIMHLAARVARTRCKSVASGPCRASLLPTAHEDAVEIRESELIPRGPAVIALASALRRFHLAQERVHLRHGQAPIGTHCC